MGGFVFDNSRNPETLPFNGGPEQIVLRPDLLVWIAENEPDIIPDISSEYITDKSKANGLAKFLVCIQAGWFGLQVITRLAQGLAVTLLELNIFAHVVCVLLTYSFWWNKPLDIDEPTAIYTDDPKAGSVCAGLWSKASPRSDMPLVVQREGQSTPELMRDTKQRVIDVSKLILSPRRAQELWSHCFGSSPTASQEDTQYISNQGYTSGDVLLELDTDSHVSIDSNRIFIELDCALVNVQLKMREVCLHRGVLSPDEQVYVAFKKYHLQRHLYAHSHSAGLNFIRSTPSRLSRTMRARIHNWYGLRWHHLTNIGIFIVANMLYGAWHLIAWNGPFRTAVEAILWKVSAVGVSVSLILEEAILVYIESAPFYWREPVNTDHESSPGHEKGLNGLKTLRSFIKFLYTCLRYFTVALSVLIFFFLIFSRTYLIVEPFISLAFVPDSVFALPQWSNYFPHIG